MNVDYRVRSIATVRNDANQVLFLVICYGMPFRELINEGNDNGARRVAKRLHARGIRTGKITQGARDAWPLLKSYGKGPL